MEKKFNQAEYIKQYNKDNYKRFYADIPKEMFDTIETKLKEDNITRAEANHMCLKTHDPQRFTWLLVISLKITVK